MENVPIEKCADVDELNHLYDASLEFGPNWRKPLTRWAAEMFPEKDMQAQLQLAAYIETVRADIENLVGVHYQSVLDKQVSAQEIMDQIQGRYPWLSKDNLRHGFGQGMYYAWHG